MAIQIVSQEQATRETGLMATQGSALPSIAEMRHRMQWMIEMRPLMREYMQSQMDPARHMYSFENNRYTPLTIEALRTMMAEGKKPALNQDGIHNLMSLFACYPDEPTIHEMREDGHYTCRATIRLISFGTGQPMGAGTGSCSTRESKYAYRWVYGNDVPKGVNLGSLKQRTFEGRNGREYTRYRLDNEDVADVEATVLQMAVKRGKSAAVKALPLVSEMFAVVGDPDEERREEDLRRQELLATLSPWLKALKGAVRIKAIQAVFGEPLRPDELAKLDEDRLAVALQVIEIATKAAVDWASPALVDELKKALQASAAKATTDLFGDQDAARAAHHAPHGAPPPATGKTSGQEGIAWDTLKAHRDDSRLPTELLERIAAALSPLAPATDTEAHKLADELLAVLDHAETEGK